MKLIIFAPKKNASAEFNFHPNTKIKKKYPEAPVEFLGMDLQEGELLFIAPKSRKTKDGNLTLEIEEGSVELVNFKEDWEEDGGTADSVVWDVDRLIEAWTSND